MPVLGGARPVGARFNPGRELQDVGGASRAGDGRRYCMGALGLYRTAAKAAPAGVRCAPACRGLVTNGPEAHSVKPRPLARAADSSRQHADAAAVQMASSSLLSPAPYSPAPYSASAATLVSLSLKRYA
jgi:hypothetical protein